ncbi:hypothetical protein MNQ98_04355 [Paenibacillus sp. N3/727]|uniref:hypothetical protein n=1 Tax=Paenibacillus sp. N3/727 TaxID=2925845 RepID=UPI001F530819|nr:hypothetical protein [Paenibacillus sp. N3/727]UNK19276.1 hypothetical protein MNQ98_04355 [Paenibacillus sp. N3/727]
MVTSNDVSEEEKNLFEKYKSLGRDASEMLRKHMTYDHVINVIQQVVKEEGVNLHIPTLEKILLSHDGELGIIKTELMLNELERSKITIQLGEIFWDLHEAYPDE